MEYRPVSDRLIMARFNCQPVNVTIIQVYAPTSDSEEEVCDKFYKELQQCINQAKRQDILICMGDWNAKMGTERVGWEEIMGKFGYGTRNMRGERLLQFASINNLYVSNTRFKHKPSRKWTWESPNGRDKNMIDMILVSKSWMSSIQGCRSFPGADLATDHNLVICNLKLHLKKLQAPKPGKLKKFDLEKLKNEPTNTAYKTEVMIRTHDMELDQDVNKALSQINGAITEAAIKEVGYERKRKKPWITDTTLDLADEKRVARTKRYRSDLDRRVYNDLVRKTKESAKRDKEQWIEDKCEEVQQSFDHSKSRKAYGLIREIKKKHEPRMNNIKDKSGKILTEKQEIMQRWEEYCKELYSDNGIHDLSILEELEAISPPTNQTDDYIMKEEIVKAIQDLKNNKSTGSDGIPAELIKEGGEQLINLFHQLCQKVWNEEKIPAEWTKSILILIPKKGDKTECGNYRTISLINHSSKIFLSILLQRLKGEIEPYLSEEQAGFRKDRGTIQQILCLRLIAEKYREVDQEVYNCFVDFKKAFDLVWHDGLWAVLRSYGVSLKLITLLRNIYKYNFT